MQRRGGKSLQRPAEKSLMQLRKKKTTQAANGTDIQKSALPSAWNFMNTTGSGKQTGCPQTIWTRFPSGSGKSFWQVLKSVWTRMPQWDSSCPAGWILPWSAERQPGSWTDLFRLFQSAWIWMPLTSNMPAKWRTISAVTTTK